MPTPEKTKYLSITCLLRRCSLKQALEPLRCAVLLPVTLLAVSAAAHGQVVAAVAANMRPAFEEIRRAFTLSTGIPVAPVYGSSGVLVAQIRNGAPYHAFISADTDRPDSLASWNLTIGPPRIYAYGALVLWTTRGTSLEGGMHALLDPSVKSVGMADLRLTVYGPAAREALLSAGLWPTVKSKCVFGENITTVAHFVVTGAVDAGFVAASAVTGRTMQGREQWISIDPALYTPPPQAAVAIRRNDRYDSSAVRLVAFLFDSRSRDLLQHYGYRLP